MSTYAVGDIQGCFDSLQELLRVIAFDPARDRLWLVGDLVNRGPQSLATLRWVKSQGEAVVTVLGNHDLHMLTVAEGFEPAKRGDTFQDVLDAPDREELLAWLRRRTLMHLENGVALVHAGLLPQWSVERARELAAEVEQALGGDAYRDFFARMYGNHPDHWQDDLQGMDRLRTITNAMTRLRFCTPEGKMEFAHKGEVEKRPEGFLPWFEVESRASRASLVVFGHWSALGLRQEGNIAALDSGCLWGGKLSAMRLEDRRTFQVPCHPYRNPTHHE
jgi:bis(5'-nucleosyl)-tetraphosphatase (symmetrical)